MFNSFTGILPHVLSLFNHAQNAPIEDDMDAEKIASLRKVISENIKVDRGKGDPIQYIEVKSELGDSTYRLNHVIYGRRGCGKSLLLRYSEGKLPVDTRVVYLNGGNFKKHSFPNVLIEILYELFLEIEKHQSRWFSRGKRSRAIIGEIKTKLMKLKEEEDRQEREIRELQSNESAHTLGVEASATLSPIGVKEYGSLTGSQKRETEIRYKINNNKMLALDLWLPDLKRKMSELFELSGKVKSIYLQIDDFYQLQMDDQPFVIDYIHRLCQELPIYFKIATLRYSSKLYTNVAGQPIGVQERHDYQPIDIDFTFSDLKRTIDQNKNILHKFGERAGINSSERCVKLKGVAFQSPIGKAC